MKRRISSRKVAPTRLNLPEKEHGLQLTLLAYGNLVSIDKIPHLWWLFCDEKKELYESLQPLTLAPYFTLGQTFQHGFPVPSTHTKQLYSLNVNNQKAPLNELPRKLLQMDVSKLQGNYQKQKCIKVRNKQILLADLLIRALCPDPGFGKIILTLLSERFIFKHIYKEQDLLFVELSGIFPLRITHATARQLARLAGSPEYHDWQASIAFSAGEILSSSEGGAWDSPVPDFNLEVTYSALSWPESAPYYRVAQVTPKLTLPFKTITIYNKGKGETFPI